MTFDFYRFRFHFRSLGPLYFPPYKSANILRGAFGGIFRKLACSPECRDARTCENRARCPYARIFEPRASRVGGPSGLADWPRPFVFRAAHLDGRAIPSGAGFHFDTHIFDVRDPALPYFERSFAQLASEGLGPGRAPAELTRVEQLGASPISFDLSTPARELHRIRVRFLTPTELKTENSACARPEFPILFARLRDRISTLRALYGAGPLDIDFHAMGARAAEIRMTRCELQRHHAERLSSRTGQRHPLGGFTGEADYEGDLIEFLPYLELGKWVGVGRQTVWGKGEIETTRTAAPQSD